ncbi:MAG: MBL fold metallo-hydrolase [Treponema sp.]|nr:MBL fold metallo-hydrolase [Treponema sp.]
MLKNNIIRIIVGAISTNCWIYKIDESSAAVIDPGDEAEKIIAALGKNKLVPKYILLTHGHFDHIAAIPDLAGAFNPVPEIAIHRLDSEYLGPEAYKAHILSIKAAMGNSYFIDALWKNMPPPDHLLDEADTIGPFTVLHLPGHTRGSIAFWDREESVLFSGDTLFKGAYGRTDLPGGDENDIINSLNRLYKMDGNIRVYPGHDEITTIEQERSRR